MLVKKDGSVEHGIITAYTDNGLWMRTVDGNTYDIYLDDIENITVEPERVAAEKKEIIPEKHKKSVSEYRKKLRFHMSNPAKIFYGFLAVFIVLTILNIKSPEFIQAMYVLVICAMEISGILWLLFKLDRISTHSTLRLWGLRILAGTFVFIGLWLLLMLWGMAFWTILFSPMAMMLSPSFFPFLIPSIGMIGIGAYLEFKFRTRSGVIVYRG